MSGSPRHFVVLTPGIAGTDGIAALSRLVVRALQASRGEASMIEIVSLAESMSPELRSRFAPAGFVGAGGSKTRFVTSALRAAWRVDQGTWVVCVHLHLGPAALPLTWRGARLATMLCGIEAWEPLSGAPRHVLQRSEVIIAISAHTARRFQATHPSFANRTVQVCHLAVPDDTDRFETRPPTASQPYALIVGRMAAEERYKGHDLLLDIWPQVVAVVPEARLIVAGDGNDRKRLEERARQLGLQERVAFLGHVPDQTLKSLYRDCSFFVMPSRDEGFGLVFLEAMRAGKACIGGIGAAAEIIQDGITGWVVDPRQPEDTLNAVVRLFRELETREGMGRAGAIRVAQEFSEASFRRRFRRLFGLEPGAAC
ncbi:MAG TPA: glycosyltransferase family 4 protein [Candidatus Acidoferrales bacterium]|nr:glycosyltransferase family 4 protein [Candidatus Acidoferrales bacterium]